jgi:hypothetical protein
MNAAEHIVDCYFRVVKKCFTMNDAKVIGGVNRQLDILAVNLLSGDQYHIESSVTHQLGWALKPAGLKKVFDKKFLGLAPERKGRRTDFALGRHYSANILETYEAYGLTPDKVQRVCVCWTLHAKSPADDFLHSFEQEHKMRISVVSFRDTVIPELQNAIGTANYDDEILRTLGFIKQREKQTSRRK